MGMQLTDQYMLEISSFSLMLKFDPCRKADRGLVLVQLINMFPKLG